MNKQIRTSVGSTWSEHKRYETRATCAGVIYFIDVRIVCFFGSLDSTTEEFRSFAGKGAIILLGIFAMIMFPSMSFNAWAV